MVVENPENKECQYCQWWKRIRGSWSFNLGWDRLDYGDCCFMPEKIKTKESDKCHYWQKIE